MNHPQRALHRAVFEDLLGDGEHHFGHLIAVMGRMEAVEIARAFAVAGHRLLEQARKVHETWEAAHPILFCYRHTLELYLKAVVQPKQRNHGLGELWANLHDQLQSRFREDHVVWLGARIREFDTIEPRSTAFRYHDAHPQHIDPELWVDFNHLAVQASRIFEAMEAIWRWMMACEASEGRFG